MVVPQPPSYFGFTYHSSISNKSKETMTMDEYKQWFMNEMSGMPVSGWYRSTCVGGATPEQCHGEGILVKDGAQLSTDNGKSWWEKCHERMDELMEEQEKAALKKAQARKAQAQAEYLKSQMASRQRLHDLLGFYQWEGGIWII